MTRGHRQTEHDLLLDQIEQIQARNAWDRIDIVILLVPRRKLSCARDQNYVTFCVELQRKPLKTALTTQPQIHLRTNVERWLPVARCIPCDLVAHAALVVEQDVCQSRQLIERENPVYT
jgi:hypothetical protein